MYINEVLEYDWNYAEYIVSDGKNELICMCESVPLPLGKTPKTGMQIAQLYAFTFDDIKLKKVDADNMQRYFIKKGKNRFDYTLQGKIEDKQKAFVCIGGFSISLEKDFENGLPEGFENGDYVAFTVDRLDCTLEQKPTNK